MDVYANDIASRRTLINPRLELGAQAGPPGLIYKNGPNVGAPPPPVYTSRRRQYSQENDGTIRFRPWCSLPPPPTTTAHRAFRGGDTQGIIASGSTVPAIPSSSTWPAPGRRTYLDAQLDEALNITRIALGREDSDSPDVDSLPDISRIKNTPRRIPVDFPYRQKNNRKTR